mgnify:CR=1 FL=1
MTYERKPVNAPRLSGIALKALAAVASSVAGGPVRQQLLKEANIPVLLESSAHDDLALDVAALFA